MPAKWIVFFVLVHGAIAVTAQKPVIEWVDIPGGTFTMGSPRNEANRKDDEHQHKVTLSAFKMSKFEITVAQFKVFVDSTGYITDAEKGTGGRKGSALWSGEKWKSNAKVNWRYDELGHLLPPGEYNHPVVHMSWNDAKAFADWLGCSLPTEAQWEYAARAGTTTAFWSGKCLNTSQGNFNGDYPYLNCSKGPFPGRIMPVGSYDANPWGLYDMEGNVREWCSDCYDLYPGESQVNPAGPESGGHRVFRGGAWCIPASACRSALRSCSKPDGRYDYLGFRVVSFL